LRRGVTGQGLFPECITVSELPALTAPPVAPLPTNLASFRYQSYLGLRILAPQPATLFVRGVNLPSDLL
jgi:hypothetical protein